MTLEIRLLGSPRFTQGGQRLNLSRRKSIALLSYVAVTRQPHSRDALVGLFWPEFNQSTARSNLRRDLSWLRKKLPDEVLLVDRLRIEMNSMAAIRVDVHDFADGLAAVQAHHYHHNILCAQCAQTLVETVNLYQGEFMAGFSLSDCAEFDEWLFFQREQRQQETGVALQQLVYWCSEQKMFEEGIRYGRHRLTLDPWHEPAHRDLMKLYAWSGQQAAALRQYEECVRLLDEALGIEPEEETTALYETIQTRKIGKATAKKRLLPDTATIQDSPPSPVEVIEVVPKIDYELPIAATPLIGRQVEQRDLTALLTQAETRLVTITGAGGMGKTRLALALATFFQAQTDPAPFPDGVYFVELAAIDNTDLILPTLAQALGIRLDQDSQQLTAHLRDKKVIVVLDNFEHLLDGVSTVGDLLQHLPHLTILVTSRERLRLQGEYIYPLSGLDIPTTDMPESAARELFVSSARRVQPTFVPTKSEWTDIIRICRLVEGMPLALELAGSWVDTLSPGEIADEIGRSLDFLETELVDVPSRHRSVRAAIDGSWQKLSAEQQQQMSRLSVLRGSFTRQAAQTIADVTVRTLTHLINKSFVGFKQQTKRYNIHALILQFAFEQLVQNPVEKETTEATHAHYFSELLGSWRWFTPYSQIEPTLDQVELEIDNIRVMWQWIVAHEDVGRVYHGFTTLGRFFLLRGSLSEGISLLQLAAEMVAKVEGESVLLGRITAVLATLHRWRGNYERTLSTAGQALTIGQALDAADVMALALFEWGYALWRLSQYDACREKLNEALVLARQAQLSFLEADVLRTLGLISFIRGEIDAAEQMFTEALTLFQGCQEVQGEALTVNNLGMVKAERKQMRQATSLFKQSMALHRQVKDRGGEARAMTNLANIESEMGQIMPAIKHSRQALVMHREGGIRLGEAVNLGWLGKMFTDLGQFDTAREHLQQGVTLCRQIGAKQDEINMLVKSSQLELQAENDDIAYQFAQQALALAQEFEVARQIPAAMNCCGHALWRLRDGDAAQAAYQNALNRLTGDDQAKSRTEPQAGLARLALEQGEVEKALAHVEPILPLIARRPLTGIFDAYGIYLTCYEVLRAAGDERARGVLETAVHRVEAQAQHLVDYTLRASFLKNVPSHRRLLEAYHA